MILKIRYCCWLKKETEQCRGENDVTNVLISWREEIFLTFNLGMISFLKKKNQNSVLNPKQLSLMRYSCTVLSCGFILHYAVFAASSFRLSECSVFTFLYFRMSLQFFHFVSCDEFFVLFPSLVVSHSIFMCESPWIFLYPCLLLLPSSYFLSLYLLYVKRLYIQ